MRLSSDKVKFLKNLILAVYSDAEIYLFGSRVDDNKKGGDIDLLVLTDIEINASSNRKVLTEFCKRFGEQKIDLVVENNRQAPFVQVALDEAIAL